MAPAEDRVHKVPKLVQEGLELVMRQQAAREVAGEGCGELVGL